MMASRLAAALLGCGTGMLLAAAHIAARDNAPNRLLLGIGVATVATLLAVVAG